MRRQSARHAGQRHGARLMRETLSDYTPPSWVIWHLDRDHRTGAADPIANALALARLTLADANARVAWLEAGAPGWTRRGASYSPPPGRE